MEDRYRGRRIVAVQLGFVMAKTHEDYIDFLNKQEPPEETKCPFAWGKLYGSWLYLHEIVKFRDEYKKWKPTGK